MEKIIETEWVYDEIGNFVTTEDHKVRICDIRGWGYLTGAGVGALHLNEEEAVRIQALIGRLIAKAPKMLKLIDKLTNSEEHNKRELYKDVFDIMVEMNR